MNAHRASWIRLIRLGIVLAGCWLAFQPVLQAIAETSRAAASSRLVPASLRAAETAATGRAAASGSLVWDSQAVGEGSLPAFELDESGLAHLVYYRPSQQALIYAHQLPGGGWAEESAVTGLEGLAAPPGMALEAGGRVHVLYLDLGGQIRYSRRDCPAGLCSWTSMPAVPEVALACGRVPLVLDVISRVHTLLCLPAGLMEYHFDGTQWAAYTELATGEVTAAVLVRNWSGGMKAAFTNAGDLYWAVHDGSDWSSVSLLREGSLSGPALVVPDHDVEYLAYFDRSDPRQLMAGRRWPADWDLRAVPTGGLSLPEEVAALSMVVREGKIHLAFAPQGGGGLWYLFQSGQESWELDLPPGWGRDPLLRLDGEGMAHLAYEDSLGQVVLAYQARPYYFPVMFR